MSCRSQRRNEHSFQYQRIYVVLASTFKTGVMAGSPPPKMKIAFESIQERLEPLLGRFLMPKVINPAQKMYPEIQPPSRGL